MQTRNYPYNDYPYQDYPCNDYPYTRQGQRPASAKKGHSYSKGSGAFPIGGTLYFAFLATTFCTRYCCFLWIGYSLAKVLLPAGSSPVSFLLLLLATSLIAYELYYLLKGIYLGLRKRKIIGWIPLFALSICLTFLLPALQSYLTLSRYFSRAGFPSGYAALPVLGILLFLYRHHRPLSPSATRLTTYSFQCGQDIARG